MNIACLALRKMPREGTKKGQISVKRMKKA